MSARPRRVVVVGGVAGGMSAATRLRRLDPHASIVVLERSGHVSYANCGLPYHLGGVIEDEADLLLQTPASLRATFGLDVRVHTEATAIDRSARTVTAKDLRTGESTEVSYDHLVLSPGAAPIVPPLPGIERALPLRTVEDVRRLVTAVAAGPRRAVVVGGGFIGLEAAENLRHRGLDVDLVEAAPQVLAPLDPELAAPVAAELGRHGVTLHLGSALAGIDDDGVHLATGAVLPADLVVLAIGVRPDTSLAAGAGLELGPRGGIRVDGRYRTADPAIHAVGDAVEKADAVTGEQVLVPLANVANRAGRMVADDILGRPVREAPALGTAIVRVFELTAAVTGWNEKRCRAAGLDVRVVHTHPGSHAGYFPGASTMHLKLVVAPDGRILGAQGVGRDGVDKRIDVIATAIRGGLHAAELADLELAYAPPYGSAKDPVNLLGYVAGNVLDGFTPTVQWHELDAELAAGAVLVDVRTPAEFAAGHIDGALNLPLDELIDRHGELPTGRRVVVMCRAGQRGHSASAALRGRGVAAANLDGGWLTWQAGTAAG